ncbi:MAG TPA: HAD-IIIA family hydrolase [Rhodanobacteraceae bacterium]
MPMTAELFNFASDAVRERASRIRLAAFDVDGTLTDGRLWYTEDGHELKAFHAHDGHGLKRLMAHGITVAIITARVSRPVALRAEELGIDHVYQGQKDKRACLAQLQKALGVTAEQTAFTGDDLSDVPAMQVSGLAVAVANAHTQVLPYTHWQTRQCGGDGAAREVCDLILSAQGKLDLAKPA